jgi:hypothetical protein
VAGVQACREDALEKAAVSANALLLWMSARQAGSWHQFRAAVEELHLGSPEDGSDEEEAGRRDTFPLYQALRLNLQRLGHAEFFAGAGDREWRVTPPSLAVTNHVRGWLGVIAGARSSNLLRRLEEATHSGELEVIGAPDCPDQLRVFAADPNQLRGIAQGVGLEMQQDAPATLLMSLPPVDDPAVRHRADLPFGADWRIERFSDADLRWRPATRDEALKTAAGLFRFSFTYQHYELFCSRGQAFRIPGQVGKYLVLRRARRRVLQYDARDLRLTVLGTCRPPFLVERALILCSGVPPSFDVATKTVSYADIAPEIAELASHVLRQEFR